MTIPHPATDAGPPSPAKRGTRNRWLLLGLISALVAFVVWAAARGAPDEGVTAAGSEGDPGEIVDAHAGHDTAVSTVSTGVVHLDRETVRALGVTVVAAELGPLVRSIRTNGNVAFNETRLSTVASKYSGFAERLYVDFTGQAVSRGQPLLEIYSPELVAAQEELLAAIRLQEQLRQPASLAVVDRTATLVDAARRRLLLWDVSAAQLREIEASGQIRRTLTLYAPSTGFVTEKMVQLGQTVEMGMPLYRLADLSTVWVEADVYEQDLRFVRVGETAQVEIEAYPGERLDGRVSYVYPEVRPDTRTARVRIELANPGNRIKPGMYATVQIEAPVSDRAVLVPRDAVMHSGTHAMVFVEEAPGQYRAREVQVGAEAGARTQILSGLLAGERVVQRANFLLDSESRLGESMGAMPGMDH